MNAAVFYVLAAVIVIGAAGAVALPRPIHHGGALGVAALGAALLFFAAGAYAVGAVQLLVPAVCAGALWLGWGRSRRYASALPDEPRPRGASWAAVVVGGAVGLLVIVAVAASSRDWWHHPGAGGILTVFHYRAAFGLVLAAVLLVTGVGVALMVGRRSRDEEELDRSVEARRIREERERRRREDRELARRGRAGAPAAEAEP